ncbi:CPBP family intramembrane metalloprotease [bacterium]|nr:CPBP family intramembrane metalloprotease [bacterium]
MYGICRLGIKLFKRQISMSIIGNGTQQASQTSISTVVLLCLVMAAFFFLNFSPWSAGLYNFWLVMLIATGTVAGTALALDRKILAPVYAFKPVYILIGAASAALLYLVFYLGNMASTSLFEFAQPQIAGIYSAREEAPPWLIGLMVVLWIGPAEEMFWRGFVQRRLALRHGALAGFIVTSLVYTLVHIWGLNFMLLAAALICGLFWGAMFLLYRSVWPGLISHALWDLAIFVVFPIY